jgi:hypothetical protein
MGVRTLLSHMQKKILATQVCADTFVVMDGYFPLQEIFAKAALQQKE